MWFLKTEKLDFSLTGPGALVVLECIIERGEQAQTIPAPHERTCAIILVGTPCFPEFTSQTFGGFWGVLPNKYVHICPPAHP